MTNNDPRASAAYQAQFNQILMVYQAGRALESQGRSREAREAFETCLEMAEGMPLLIDQYLDIRLCIAFSYADESDWPAALAIYRDLEATLKQEGDWHTTIPHDIAVMIPQRYNPAPALATLADSTAIAYHKSGQVDQARRYYDYAIRTYTDLGDTAAALRTWEFMGKTARELQQWPLLQQAGEGLLALATRLNSAPHKLTAYRFLADAYREQGQPEQAADYQRRAEALEKQRGKS